MNTKKETETKENLSSLKKGLGTALVLTVLILAALAALTAPASAYYNWEGFPMTPGDGYSATYGNGTWLSNYTLHGGVYYDGGHGLANAPYEQTYTLQDFDNMLFAHVYMYVWGGTMENTGWEQLNFTNATGTTTVFDKLWLDAKNDTNKNAWISTCGAHVIWHNVTDLVTPGENTAEVNTGETGGTGFDGRVDNLHMIAVYEKAGMPERKVWVVQGHDALCHKYSDNPAHDYGIANFEGDINTSKWETAYLYTAFEAGDSGKHDTISFNGNLLCTDCANSSTYPPYMDLEVFNVTGLLNATGGQHVDWYRDGDDYQHNINVMLVLGPPPPPNLMVEEIGEPTLADHNYTLAVVAGQTYTINATIKNSAGGAANASHATLSEDGTPVGSPQSVPSLGPHGTAEIQFSWTPSTSGARTLTVTADSSGELEESNENDNSSSKGVSVYEAGTANEHDDLVMTTDDIKFLPTFELHAANDTTTVVVNMTNNGTGKVTNPFTVRLTAPGTTQNKTIISDIGAKAVKVTSFIYNASKGGPYDVNVTLDADSEVSETNEGNNDATKPLTVVKVRIMDSHHYGNTSAYNGSLSDNQTVEMFDITRLVPQNCTTWDVLNSVANVKQHPSAAWSPNTYVYGIDGLEEMPSHPTEGSIYWYQYVNGIYLPLNQKCADYKLSDGETMHWDLHRWVEAVGEDYNPRTVMAWNDLHPEPMTHGYFNMSSEQRMMWDTTIVYPSESSEYESIAQDVKARLVSRGTPIARISIATDTSITGDQKNDTNLILLGPYDDNNLTAEINPHHQKFAMVVYFNETTGKMIDDFTDTEYSYGGVVQACDNPYDNQPLGSVDSHRDEGPMLYMATGLTDKDAKRAAKLLWSEAESSKLNRFWVLQTPPNNIDINTSKELALAGKVQITWDGSADAYDIYVTDNYATGFDDTPTVEDVTTTYWDDTNAYSSPIYNVTPWARYYKVVNANESAGAYSEVVGKYDVRVHCTRTLLSVPHATKKPEINEVLKYSLWPDTRLTGGGSEDSADNLERQPEDVCPVETAWLVDVGNPQYDGKWYTGSDPSTIILPSDRGFKVYIRHTKPTNVTLRLFLD
ncbi:MAG: DUF3344 domain-containing protein [Methanophagales archaeon]|nr:DUF3344 domain-containing protein [Methanophagales archaeon]